MTNFLKTTFVAGAMALSVAAGVSAVPSAAEARGFGGGFHGGGFHGGGFRGGFGGYRGGGFRGGFYGGRGFGFGYGRGFGYRGFGYRGFGYRGPAFYGAAYPYWGAYRCGPYRHFRGACGYPFGYGYGY